MLYPDIKHSARAHRRTHQQVRANALYKLKVPQCRDSLVAFTRHLMGPWACKVESSTCRSSSLPPLTFSCTVTQHLIYITSTCELAPRKQTHYAHTQPHRHTQTRWSVKKDLHSGTASPHISARPHTRKQKQEINVTCNFYRADLSVCDRPNPIAAAGLTGLT